MNLNTATDQEFLQAALRHRLLTDDHVQQIEQQCASEKGMSARQIAIREGLFNGRKMDMLKALESPRDVAPGYAVERVLGSGGFGIVFEAQQLNLARTVALKTIQLSLLADQTAQKRFEQEARIVGKLRHPNIVTAYDFGLHDERLYLSMEYVKGIDADRLIERRGALDEFTTWHIIRQVSMALTYASEQGVIHRDIKPGNLLLTDAPTGYSLPDNVPLVKVADFGLACFRENKLRNSRITADNSAVGTPYYVAPEQLSDSQVDERADIYSLGVTAYQLIAGDPPMKNASPMKIVMKKLGGDEGWLDKMPQHFSPASVALIRKMCATDPDARVGSHRQLLDEVDKVIAAIDALGTLDFDEESGATMAFDMNDFVQSLDEDRWPTMAGDATREFNSGAQASPAITRESATQVSASGSLELTPTFSKPAPKNGDGKPETRSLPWGIAIGSTAVLGIAAAVAFFLLGGWTPMVDKDAPSSMAAAKILGIPALDQMTGPPLFLFNGSEVDPRQKFSGTWEKGEDSEGAAVLVGNGWRLFPCRDSQAEDLQAFRFRCGFMLQQAGRIEFEIATGDSTGSEQGRFAKIVIDEKSASWSSPSKVYGDARIELKMYSDNSQGYHQIYIDRQPGFLVVTVDGESLGRVSFSNEPPTAIKLIVSGDGPAFFEQVQLRAFEQK